MPLRSKTIPWLCSNDFDVPQDRDSQYMALEWTLRASPVVKVKGPKGEPLFDGGGDNNVAGC